MPTVEASGTHLSTFGTVGRLTDVFSPSSSLCLLQVLEGPCVLSWAIQESMHLKYEPASEPMSCQRVRQESNKLIHPLAESVVFFSPKEEKARQRLAHVQLWLRPKAETASQFP